MTGLLLTLVFSAAAAASDCSSTTNAANVATCTQSASNAPSSPMDSNRTSSSSVTTKQPTTRPSADDEPWSYEPDPDNEAQHVCLTRGAGGICLESDD